MLLIGRVSSPPAGILAFGLWVEYGWRFTPILTSIIYMGTEVSFGAIMLNTVTI